MPKKLVDIENLKAFRERLDDKYAEQSGAYPLLNVGKADLADNLTPYGDNSGVNDTNPFFFQTSGGNSDIGSIALLKSLRGNTFKINQLAYIKSNAPDSFSGTKSVDEGNDTLTLSGSFTNDDANHGLGGSENAFTVVENHYYLKKIKVSGAISEDLTIQFAYVEALKTIIPAGTYNNEIFSGVVKANWTNTNDVAMGHVPSTLVFTDFSIQIQLFDISDIFGVGNEPSSIINGIAEGPVYRVVDGAVTEQPIMVDIDGVTVFNRMFPQAYYEHGTILLSPESEFYSTIGSNACSGVEQGGLNESGQESTSTHSIRTDFIRVIPGQTYKIDFYNRQNYSFANGVYIFTYDNDMTFVGRTWVASSNYGPITWEKGTIVVIPNNIHYIRLIFNNYPNDLTHDENEQVSVRLIWDQRESTYVEYEYKQYNLPTIELHRVGNVYDEISYDGTYIKRIGVRTYESGDEDDADVITDGSSITYYVLDEEDQEISTVEGWALSSDIDDYGTQSFEGNDVPQGNVFFYPADYKAFIDTLGNRADIGYEAGQVVSQEQLQNAIADIDIPDPDLSNYVTTDTAQDITGTKTIRDTSLELAYTLTNPGTSDTVNWDFKDNNQVLEVSRTLYSGTRQTIWQFNGWNFLPNTDDNSRIGNNAKRLNRIHTVRLANNSSSYSVLMPDMSGWSADQQIATKIISIDSQRHLNSGEAKQCIGGAQIVSTSFVNLGNGVLIKNPYIVGYWSSGTTQMTIMAHGVNNAGLMVLHKAVLTVSSTDSTVVTESSVNTITIPANPSSTGTFVLKCVNGTLTWVAE